MNSQIVALSHATYFLIHVTSMGELRFNLVTCCHDRNAMEDPRSPRKGCSLCADCRKRRPSPPVSFAIESDFTEPDVGRTQWRALSKQVVRRFKKIPLGPLRLLTEVTSQRQAFVFTDTIHRSFEINKARLLPLIVTRLHLVSLKKGFEPLRS